MNVLLTLIESNGMWEVVSRITNPVTLVAFAIAVAALVAMKASVGSTKKTKTYLNWFWAVIVVLVLIGVGAALYPKPNNEIYRVRVTVVDPQGIPVVDPLGRPPEDLKVWANISAAPQPVPGGWQFDIPSSIKPADSKLTIRASKENAFLIGRTDLILGNDYNPTVTIQLKYDNSATVRGQVVDSEKRAVAGAMVLVVGHESEAVWTKEGGGFELHAYAALNQQVLLYAEKVGYKPTRQYHPAGDTPAELVLEK